MMKNRILTTAMVIAAMVLSAAVSRAQQDARQRTVQTIVQDALAQLPAPTEEDLAREMKDIAASAPESVEILSGMMAPASEGKNNKIEYALNGLVNYVASGEGAQYRDAVARGLTSALETCPAEHAPFLLTKLSGIAGSGEIPVFAAFASDPATASIAVGALTGIEGSEDAIMQLFSEGSVSKPLLAYAAGAKGIAAAEPYLLEWIGSLGADAQADSDVTSPSDTPDLRSYYHALSLCGTAASAKTLLKGSVYDYMTLLYRLVGTDDRKVALSGAKKQLRSDDTYIRIAALGVIASANGSKAQKDLLAALKDSDREYRNAALLLAEPYGSDNAFCDNVIKAFPKLSDQARADVLNWAGNTCSQAMLGTVLSCIPQPGEEGDDECVLAAIAAAGKIGGDSAADALVDQLGGKPVYAQAAFMALLSFEGDIQGRLSSAMDGGSQQAQIALQIASSRRMKALADKVFALLEAEDDAVAEAAARALPGVVTESDIDRISVLLAKAEPGLKLSMLQKAACAAMSGFDADARCAQTEKMMAGSGESYRYYPILAYAGTDKAVAMLDAEYSSNPEPAFAALMEVDNVAAADVLYKKASSDSARKDAALSRYIALVASNVTDPLAKVEKLSAAMSLDPSDAVMNKALNELAAVPTYPAFQLASQWLDTPGTAYAAAGAVKAIASKTEDEMDYESLKTALGKARAIYAAAGGADNGYAVDEINQILSGLQPPAPKFELSAEEAAAGFEILFDGTDMSNWEGDLRRYALINGTIYVTANYGNANNLYTKKEYKDFVFRFEFCFEKPGVNNGVGIRTPKEVDAAYHGMAEIQILDHDDPIYKGLREYQVHGSAYGVIPAKRVVHKPVGTWNEEEIRVVGDHITVTLNGEVILDGNLRKACKGHNVAPDGSDYNPYTVDHRNHPGMFNKKGHISFCGHGPGIRFRNIRVLDLSK